MKNRLSAVVVVHDEEEQLRDCLDCLDFADELVVVLDRCGDGSREIAGEYGAMLVEGSWPLEGPRRHAGIAACSGDWILEVDADERVGEDLAMEIREAISEAEDGYFLIPVDNYVGDRLVRHGWGGSFGKSSAACLFARGCKKWGNQRVHPEVVLAGPWRRLNAPLKHLVDRDISDMLARLDRTRRCGRWTSGSPGTSAAWAGTCGGYSAGSTSATSPGAATGRAPGGC